MEVLGMTAKQYLRQLERINLIINSKQLQLDELRAFGAGLRAIDYAADKIQTSPRDRMAETMARWVDLEGEINQIIDNYVDTKNRIVNEINSIPDARYMSVLYKRYVEFKTLTAIAYEMHYEYTWACKLHGEALQAFDRLILKQHKQTQ